MSGKREGYKGQVSKSRDGEDVNEMWIRSRDPEFENIKQERRRSRINQSLLKGAGSRKRAERFF